MAEILEERKARQLAAQTVEVEGVSNGE